MIKKEVYVIIALMVLILIPLTSAGFFSDMWEKITGEAVKSVTLNITVGGPQIITVYNLTMIPNPSGGLNSGPVSTGIVINFTAYHAIGTLNLNDSTAGVNFSKGGEETRTNTTCKRGPYSTYYANYTCNVTMWWWDAGGTWTITASIKDNNSNFVSNDSTDFQVGSTTGFEVSPVLLTWPGIVAGATNQTSNNDPITMNNTGNNERGLGAGSGNITVNATHLAGETDESKRLFANNFSINWDGNTGTCTGSACVECQGRNMSFGNFVNITVANLTRGNYTMNNNYTGQEQLFLCLRVVGSELTTQAYSTAKNGTWTIQI